MSDRELQHWQNPLVQGIAYQNSPIPSPCSKWLAVVSVVACGLSFTGYLPVVKMPMNYSLDLIVFHKLVHSLLNKVKSIRAEGGTFLSTGNELFLLVLFD